MCEGPKIYAKRLSGAQRRMLNDYVALTGIEPMYQEDLDSGDMTFAEVWQANISWLEGMLADAVNIDSSGAL